MIAVAIVTNIEPETEVNFHENDGSTTKHRCVNVWVKSADEDTQGSWTTVVRLYDKNIEEAKENGLSEGSMVSINIRPAYRKLKSGEFAPAVVNKLIAVI